MMSCDFISKETEQYVRGTFQIEGISHGIINPLLNTISVEGISFRKVYICSAGLRTCPAQLGGQTLCWPVFVGLSSFLLVPL